MMLEKIALPGIWWRTKTLAYKPPSPTAYAKEIKPNGILA